MSIRSDFDVFLSHNSKDKPIVRELKQALTARKLTVWFDEDELRPGLAWQPLLEQGLQTDNHFSKSFHRCWQPASRSRKKPQLPEQTFHP